MTIALVYRNSDGSVAVQPSWRRRDGLVSPNFAAANFAAWFFTVPLWMGIAMFIALVSADDAAAYKQHTCNYTNIEVYLGHFHDANLNVTMRIATGNLAADIVTRIPGCKVHSLREATSGPCYSYCSTLRLDPFSPYNFWTVAALIIGVVIVMPVALFFSLWVVIAGIHSIYVFHQQPE